MLPIIVIACLSGMIDSIFPDLLGNVFAKLFKLSSISSSISSQSQKKIFLVCAGVGIKLPLFFPVVSAFFSIYVISLLIPFSFIRIQSNMILGKSVIMRTSRLKKKTKAKY
jgi:hypothetical protein